MADIVTAIPLRQRIVRAGSWALGGMVAGHIIRLASNLITTRLLFPEMFGVMALANVLMSGVELLSDLGLRQNIIQSHRGNDPVFLNTVWSVQIIRGAFLWLLVLGLAGGIYLTNSLHLWPSHSVYADPVLPMVITVLAFNSLIRGFESTKLATANRSLSLGRITIMTLVTNSLGALMMVTWAYLAQSIWALVFGTLFTSSLRVLSSHLLLQGHGNRLLWDREAVKDILKFGKWVFLTSILGFLAANGDRLLLGGLITPEILGIYSIAFMMVSLVRELFNTVSSNVGFPALSEVTRDRSSALKEVYYKFRLPLDLSTLFICGFLFSAGHVLIQFLYDDRYLAAGHMMEILSISLFEIRYSLASQCFMAMGMPKLMIPNLLVRIVALFVLMPLAFKSWGVDGALWVVAGSGLLALPTTLYLKIKHRIFDLKRELAVLPVLALGFVCGLVFEQAARLLGWAP